MKRIVLAALTVAVIGGGAQAADVFNRGGGMKDDVAPVAGTSVNWSSIYIGGQIGVRNGNHKLSDQEYTGACKSAAGANVTQWPTSTQTSKERCLAGTGNTWVDTAIDGASAFLDGIDSHGVIGGGRLGADLQRGNFVIGAFGDYNFSNAKATAGSGSKAGGLSASIEDGDSWLIAARAGYLLGSEKRTLLYVLAGYEQQDASYHVASTGNDPFSKSVTFSGLVAGGGMEYALNNAVTLGIEYQHFFGSTENLFDGRGTDPCPQSVINDKLQSDVIMGRVNLKLNGGLFGN